MKSFIGAAAALLTASYAHAELSERQIQERDLCASGSTDDGGNWYCQLVQAVTYTGIGHDASYSRVSKMDPQSGVCTQESQSYSGTLAPFNEEVSLHFRGPLQLKQLAVYTPSSTTKRDAEEHVARHARRHGHGHANHEREAAPAVGDWVTITMNGNVVSWVNTYSGESETGAPAVNVNNNLVGAGAGAAAAVTPAAQVTQAPAATQASSSGSYGSNIGSSGAWARQGYYNAASGTSNGLVFLNHKGGSGSGTFDWNFGNSLSYSDASGTAGSANPVTLGNVQIPSTGEVVVMTDKKCDLEKQDCGYVRPNTVAYHGFDGAEKIFLMEFSMPVTGEKASSIYSPVDMPAIWMLNAQIPRTLQYGKQECSCWLSGCGEFDIFEVLAPGDTRCKSTIHGNARGGDSDYFARPTSGTAKAAVVMHNNQFHIKMLDASTNFDQSLDSSFVDGIVSSTASQNSLVSLFGLA